MTNWLRWQTEHDKGRFVLLSQAIFLTWNGEEFELGSGGSTGIDGVWVETREGGKRVAMEATGQFKLSADGTSFRKVVLPSNRSIDFDCGDSTGNLKYSASLAHGDKNIGREIDGYQILDVLGAGAVGIVYRAKQIALDREVALKTLNPKAAQEPLTVVSFKREAVAAGRLNHPHLVQVHDVVTEGDFHAYAMELVPGGNLEEHLEEHGPLTWREALIAIRECALALDFAEEHELIHRDVKPENLMISDSGSFKLADLGLASTRGIVDTASAGGTPHFMAPECAQQKPFDHRADLYSLGCTYFRLVTGETVFEGASVKEILRSHIEEEPPLLKDMGIKTPQMVQELLSSLLAKDPESRPSSASQVADQCSEILAGRRSRKMMVAFFGIVAVGLGLLLKQPPEMIEQNPTIVEVVRNDPHAAEREAELNRTREQLALAQAKNQPAGELRRSALQKFIADFPTSSFLEEAQASLLAAQGTPEVPTLPVKTADQLANELVTDRIQEAISAKQLGTAWGIAMAFHEHLSQEDQAAHQARVEVAINRQFAFCNKAHGELLAQRQWSEAMNLETVGRDSLAEGPQEDLAQWIQEIDNWQQLRFEGMAVHAKSLDLKDRQVLLSTLTEEVLPQAQLTRFSLATDTFQATLNELNNLPLSSLYKPYLVALRDAAKVNLAIEDSIQQQGAPPCTEPLSERKATLVNWTSDGPEFEYQERGTKVRTVRPWQALKSPEQWVRLLSDVCPIQVKDDSKSAFLLFIAVSQLREQGELVLNGSPSS
ncbi:MAG: serine/threonine protein kinase, partial [Planctomycetes bacterium]|nr:serine/threonine protein kinase [Planctomycetota bacterium]